MKTFKTISLLVSVATMLSACASQVKKEEVAKVHRVAIIGFDALQQRSVSGNDLMGAFLGKMNDNSAKVKVATESAHVDPMLANFQQRLEKNLKWVVVPISDVRKNALYKDLYKKKTEGMQNRPAVEERYDPFRAPGIIDFWGVMTTEKETLQALAKELRVDALIIGSTKVHLNNSSMMASLVGKGEYKPSADFTMVVIQGPTADKIFTKMVEGPQSELGEKNTAGMADNAKLNALAQIATASSIEKMMKEVPK
ncbi:MAG: hypothetical protein EOP06_09085 [Proteobacteria bacterium]|nr:MAG: hypothetical protein EOP06_09085 [Pseudomonadota bacterium]